MQKERDTPQALTGYHRLGWDPGSSLLKNSENKELENNPIEE